MSQRIDEAKWSRHFDGAAGDYFSNYEGQNPASHSLRVRRERAKELLGTGSLGKLLDVGGATGTYYALVKDQTTSYDIVDISPQMIEKATEQFGADAKLSCRVASAYELPFPDETFDTVLEMGLLEYLEEPWKALVETSRVMKRGGVLVASFPNAQSPMRRLTRLIYATVGKSNPMGRQFRLDDVSRAAEDAGLSVDSVSAYNAQLFPWPLTWRLERFAYLSAVQLEPVLARTAGMWGTGFIVKLRKR